MTFKQGRFFLLCFFFSTYVLSHGCLTFKSSRDKKGKIKLALRYYLNCKKKKKQTSHMEKKVRDFARKVTFFHSLWKRSNEIVFKTWGPFLERPGNLSGSKSNSFNFDPLAVKSCSFSMFQT